MALVSLCALQENMIGYLIFQAKKNKNQMGQKKIMPELSTEGKWGKLLSGWNLFIVVILILIFSVSAFADIAIYCPYCKTHLYNYQKEEIAVNSQFLAKDFKPENDSIKQPIESDYMVCPLDSCPLNQYESWAWERKMKPPVFKVWAVSLLTKDENGNWKGVPYDVKFEDWERK